MGAGWCPPGMLGIGIGGSAEKAMVLAKESLMDPIDMHELKSAGASQPDRGAAPARFFDEVNALGIGAQGLGGLTTVLDVKIMDYPTHAASLPVAMIPNCAATRHAHFVMDGAGPVGPAGSESGRLAAGGMGARAGARRVNLDTVTRDDILGWKPGEPLLLRAGC